MGCQGERKKYRTQFFLCLENISMSSREKSALKARAGKTYQKFWTAHPIFCLKKENHLDVNHALSRIPKCLQDCNKPDYRHSLLNPKLLKTIFYLLYGTKQECECQAAGSYQTPNISAISSSYRLRLSGYLNSPFASPGTGCPDGEFFTMINILGWETQNDVQK